VNPRAAARLLAGGRAALGLGLVVAPRPLAARWLGPLADRPAAQSLVRLIGVRDFVLGMIALHTLDHPEVGPRWQATCAAVDALDAGATLAARRDLPRFGAYGTIALAGNAAAVGLWCSRALKG
jgi:hypothetical protein